MSVTRHTLHGEVPLYVWIQYCIYYIVMLQGSEGAVLSKPYTMEDGVCLEEYNILSLNILISLCCSEKCLAYHQ